MRRLAVIVALLAALTVTAPAHADYTPAVHFAGRSAQGWQDVSAAIETPPGPIVWNGPGYAYQWVMVLDPDDPNGWLAQVGWIAGPAYARPVVATYGQDDAGHSWYVEHPEIALSPGQPVVYRAEENADTTVSLYADGVLLDTFPVGAEWQPQVQEALETKGGPGVPATTVSGLRVGVAGLWFDWRDGMLNSATF